jgi:hypothetical protein
VKGAEARASQAEAIELALRLAAPSGATVHVFGGPEGGDCGEGEVVCGPPFEVEEVRVAFDAPRVIFHASSVVLAGGGWACLSCGREGGRPARPLLRS